MSAAGVQSGVYIAASGIVGRIQSIPVDRCGFQGSVSAEKVSIMIWVA